MALQTSGAISLNDIHVEAGGTTGTSATINDADIRGLTAASGYTIPTGSGTAIDFGDFYGASNVSTFNSFSYAAERADQASISIGQTTSASGTTFASAFGVAAFRLRLASNVLYFEVKKIAGNTVIANDGNTSGVQDGTFTGITTSYVSLGSISVPSPVDVKVDWAYVISGTGGTGSMSGNTASTGATYSLSDNSFQTLTNGQSAGFITSVSNSRFSYSSGSQSRYLQISQMKLSLQKTGYTTAEVADFDAQMTAIATTTGSGGGGFGGGGGGGFEP